MQSRNQAGFSLIELIIAVAIVGILAAVAYPSYQEQVRKGKRTDATGTLLDVAQRLERCYTQFNAYNDGNCATHTGLNGAGIASPEGEYNITYRVAPTATTFQLLASPTGSQASDERCHEFRYDNVGRKAVENKANTVFDDPSSATDKTEIDYCW